MACIPDGKRVPCAVAYCGTLVHVPGVDMEAEAEAEAGSLFVCPACQERITFGVEWRPEHGRD